MAIGKSPKIDAVAQPVEDLVKALEVGGAAQGPVQRFAPSHSS
jgi:hypothetical protein